MLIQRIRVSFSSCGAPLARPHLWPAELCKQELCCGVALLCAPSHCFKTVSDLPPSSCNPIMARSHSPPGWNLPIPGLRDVNPLASIYTHFECSPICSQNKLRPVILDPYSDYCLLQQKSHMDSYPLRTCDFFLSCLGPRRVMCGCQRPPRPSPARRWPERMSGEEQTYVTARISTLTSDISLIILICGEV